MTTNMDPRFEKVTPQKFREVSFEGELDSYPYSLNYWVWEGTNICTEYKVSFHYGCGDIFEYVEEMIREIVCFLEGKEMDFQSQIVIE